MIDSSRLSALILVAAVLTAAAAPSAAAASGVALQSDDAQSWTVDRGEEVTVALDIGNATDGTLTFGDENETNYEATATVEDTNGNGTVVVVLDTGSLGVDSIDEGLQAGPGTAVSNASQSDLEEQLSPYEYDLTLEADGDSVDAGTVLIESADADESNSSDEESASNESTDSGNSTDANETEDGEENGGFALPGFGAPIALAVLGSIVAIGARHSRSQ
ncbi:DUF7827 domain-containing protein [Halopiger thermotolerans]